MNNLENLATAIGTDIKDLKMQTANTQEKISANTESLNRIATQMDSLVTKSEIKQDIDGLAKAQADSIRQEILNATKDKADKTLVVAEAGKLREEFSKMKVGSRNYAEDYDFSRGLWYYTQGDNSPQDWTISNGEYNVKGTTNTWKQMQIYSKEGSIASGKSSTALLELELGETYTLSFQAMCHSGNPRVWVSLRANRTVPGNPEIISGTFTLTPSWQTYQVTIPALTKPENFDFWRIILGYNEVGHVAFRKVELTRSSTRIDAGPAPEDAQTQVTETQESLRGLERKFETFKEQQFTKEEFNSKDCITGSTEYQVLKHQVESLVKQTQTLQEQLALVKPAPRRAPMAYTIDLNSTPPIAWFDNGCGLDVGNNLTILGAKRSQGLSNQPPVYDFPNAIIRTSMGILGLDEWKKARFDYWHDTVKVLNPLKSADDYDWTRARLTERGSMHEYQWNNQRNIIRVMYQLGIWDAKTVESLGAVRR